MQLIAGRFELGQQIGAGGMGAVYLGLDRETGAQVAIKQLLPQYLAGNTGVVERFIREGEALRQLNHPNIVKMVAAVQEADHHYLILEYMPGGSLADLLLQTNQLPIQQAIEIALDLADALTRAHRLNIIHRDIKPHNILLAADGTPRLTDFGIARINNSHITETGAVIGTLAYLCPEALNGEPMDVQSDIWAFGVVLFEMLAGQRPFKGETLEHLMRQIMFAPPPDLEKLRPDAPPALIDLIYRMLVKTPAERIPSVRVVGTELEALLRGTTSLPSRPLVKLLDDEPTRFITPTPEKSIQRHNLPAQMTAFVGREAELMQLASLIATPDIRLITILAPGGMGKTRLSIEAGQAQLDRFADGVFFIDLAPLSTAEGIPTALAEAVGYPYMADQRPPQQQLLDYLRGKQELLIFDNFEHVLVGADFLIAILKAAPEVKIVVTSRERLNLSGETLFTLAGLDFPDWETPAGALSYAAVKLFLQSARRVQPAFELAADHLPYVARICRLVAGMPLGLVLAAAWLEMLSLEEIAAEIQQSLDFLETEQRDIPERQRSIRTVFEYTWTRLSDTEKNVFKRLSVFRGGFTRQAAQTVTGATLHDLQRLMNKSLIQRDVVSGRYHVHELLRQYAENELQADPAAYDQALAAHCRCYTDLLAKLEADLIGSRQVEALETIESDLDNIRSAWRWAAQERRFELWAASVFSFIQFLETRSYEIEGVELFDLMFKSIEEATTSGELILASYCKIGGGFFLLRLRDVEKSLLYLDRGLTLAYESGDQATVSHALHYWMRVYSTRRSSEPITIQRINEALNLYEHTANHWAMAWALNAKALNVGATSGFTDPEVRQILEEGLSLFRHIGNPSGIAAILGNLSIFWMAEAKFEEALVCLREASEISTRMKIQRLIIQQLGNMAVIASLLGDYSQAILYSERSFGLAKELGLKQEMILACIDLCHISCFQGTITQAENWLHTLKTLADKSNNAQVSFMEASIALAKGDDMVGRTYLEQALASFPDNRNQAHILSDLACVEVRLSAVDKAEQYAYQALEVASQVKDDILQIVSLIAFAQVYYKREQRTHAVELATLAENLAISPFDVRQKAATLLHKIKTEVDGATFQAAQARGKTLTLKTTVQEILQAGQ